MLLRCSFIVDVVLSLSLALFFILYERTSKYVIVCMYIFYDIIAVFIVTEWTTVHDPNTSQWLFAWTPKHTRNTIQIYLYRYIMYTFISVSLSLSHFWFFHFSFHLLFCIEISTFYTLAYYFAIFFYKFIRKSCMFSFFVSLKYHIFFSFSFFFNSFLRLSIDWYTHRYRGTRSHV